MKINGKIAYDYTHAGNDLMLILGCTVDEALAMNTAMIEVRTDAGDLVETFVGYAKRRAAVDAITGRVTLELFTTGDNAAQAVDALNQKIDNTSTTIQAQLDALVGYNVTEV